MTPLHHVKPWRVAVASVGLIAAITVSACSSSGSNSGAGPTGSGGNASVKTAKVKFFVPVAGSLANLPLFVAQDKYFKSHGIDISVQSASGPQADIAAIVGGDAQFDMSAATLAAVEHGAPLVAVMNVNNKSIASVVLRKDVAQRLNVTSSSPLSARLAALNGLKIGISAPGSFFETVYNYYVKQGHLKGTRVVSVGGGQTALAALKNKSVDALIYSSPVTDAVVADGSAISLLQPASGTDAPEFSNYFMTQVVVSKKYLAGNKNTVKRVLAALVQASTWIKTASPDAIAALVKDQIPNVPPAVLAAAIKSTQNIVNANGCTTQDAITNAVKSGATTKSFTLDQVATNDYLPQSCS